MHFQFLMYRANVEYQKIQIYNVTKLVFSKATKLINVRRFLKFYLFGIINYNNVYLHIYMRVIFGFYLLIKQLMNKTPWHSLKLAGASLHDSFFLSRAYVS